MLHGRQTIRLEGDIMRARWVWLIASLPVIGIPCVAARGAVPEVAVKDAKAVFPMTPQSIVTFSGKITE